MYLFIKWLHKNMKNGVYVVNLDDCRSIGTHRIALYVIGNNVT